MKMIFATTCYESFLKYFYGDNPSLSEMSFSEQMDKLIKDSFWGVSPSYTKHFNESGIDTQFCALNAPMQKKWAQEQNLRAKNYPKLNFRLRRKFIPWIELKKNETWMKKVFLEQVKRFKPDVIVSMNIQLLNGEIARELRKHCKLLIGQCASPINNIDISSYDLIVTALPDYIKKFQDKGIKTEYLRLGFPADVLSRLKHHDQTITNITFAGGIGGVNHKDRIGILEELSLLEKVRLHGYLNGRISVFSPLKRLNITPIVGLPMFQAFHDSKIVFNKHAGLAGKYAVNIRMYEATGVGSLLLTDNKSNIKEFFEPNKEVVVYNSKEECLDKIKYLLEHEDERKKIAIAGQKRTLAEHTYKHRSKELFEIIRNYI